MYIIERRGNHEDETLFEGKMENLKIRYIAKDGALKRGGKPMKKGFELEGAEAQGHLDKYTGYFEIVEPPKPAVTKSKKGKR